MDLTPIDLEELERYGLATFKCERTLLPLGLERAIGEICEEAIGAVTSFAPIVDAKQVVACQNEVNRRLEDFNRDRIHLFNSGMLARAEAQASVWQATAPETPYSSAYEVIRYRFWVKYTGITQEQADALPKYVRDDFYSNYLRGWSSQTKAQLVAASAQDRVGAALKTFIGQTKTSQLENMIKAEIRRALKEVEGLDLDKATINVYEGQIQIQAFVENQVIRINGTYA